MASITGNTVFWTAPYLEYIVFSTLPTLPSDTGSYVYLTVTPSGPAFKKGTVTKQLLNATDIIQYESGNGGSVIQLTSKSTPVTLNKKTGYITMHSSTLSSGSIVYFEFNNTFISSMVNPNVYICSSSSEITPGAYRTWSDSIDSGKCRIYLQNYSGSSLSEEVRIGFLLTKNNYS